MFPTRQNDLLFHAVTWQTVSLTLLLKFLVWSPGWHKKTKSQLPAAHAQALQSNEPLTTDSSNLIQPTCHKQCPDVIHIYPTISTTQSPLSRPATLAYERCQVKSWNKNVAALPRLLVDSCASPCIGGTSLKRIPSLLVIKQETPRPPWAIFLKSLIQRLQKSIAAPQHMIR